METKR